jgi:hypothetical protein
MPKAVGTLKDKSKETVEISIGDGRLQQVLCTSGDDQVEDMMDVDEEVDDASLMSSRAGSMCSRADSVQTEAGYNSDGSMEAADEDGKWKRHIY